MSINQAGLISRRYWFLFVAAVLVLQSLTVQATAATLEELERKIEQQKGNQRRANTAKPTGTVNSPRATVPQWLAGQWRAGSLNVAELEQAIESKRTTLKAPREGLHKPPEHVLGTGLIA